MTFIIPTFASFTEAREANETAFLIAEILGEDFRLTYFDTGAGYPECIDIIEADDAETAVAFMAHRNPKIIN